MTPFLRAEHKNELVRDIIDDAACDNSRRVAGDRLRPGDDARL